MFVLRCLLILICHKHTYRQHRAIFNINKSHLVSIYNEICFKGILKDFVQVSGRTTIYVLRLKCVYYTFYSWLLFFLWTYAAYIVKAKLITCFNTLWEKIYFHRRVPTFLHYVKCKTGRGIFYLRELRFSQFKMLFCDMKW